MVEFEGETDEPIEECAQCGETWNAAYLEDGVCEDCRED